jgi:hypothetical protein
MNRRIISESHLNRLQELAGILEENAQKIMKLGFSEPIAEYLAAIDKKRGMYFADVVTRDYLDKKGEPELAKQNLKQVLPNIDQAELFDYIKSRENDIRMVADWVKQSQGQVNLKSFNSFEEAVTAAYESMAGSDDSEDLEFIEPVERFLRKIDYDAGLEIGRLALISYAKHHLKDEGLPMDDESMLLSFIDQNDFMTFLYDNENQMYNITDWLNSPALEDAMQMKDKSLFIKDSEFEDFDELLAAAMEWHSNLAATGKLADPTAGKVIRRYPSGYYWVDLETNRSKDEAQAMGHCGTDTRATTLFANKKNITQVKGKNNKRPVDKYMEYVMEFLKDMAKNGELTSVAWSYYGDLTPEEVDEIFKVNKKTYFRYLKSKTKTSTSNLVTRY